MTNDNLLVLNRFTDKLSNISNVSDVSDILCNFFADNEINIKSSYIYIYDNTINALRVMNETRSIVNKDTEKEIYEKFEALKDSELSVNGKYYNYSSVPQNINISISSADLKYCEEGICGFVSLEFKEKINVNTSFLSLLKIFISILSLKIHNLILSEQMKINVDFHDSMKNIAKIIETQYELNYILPLIGEMLDKFISSHLIYVFLKENDKYKLVWPKSCRDKQILKMLDELTLDKKSIISEDSKRGLFALTADKKVTGAIAALSISENLTQKETEYLEQLTQQASATINRANSYAETLKYATLDALTGLNNRRQFETRLNQEISAAKRQKTPLCAMMIDIDFFKKINDTYGHANGDKALKKLAEIIKVQLRESDIASRYGGEEFAIILPNTKLEEAYLVAERLRCAVEKEPVNIHSKDTDKINLSVSIGLSQYEQDSERDKMFNDADNALYQAKKNGRNRVVKYEK
ncbi:GGDEF domain-containing protein [bacterium]|nr:GGDEF domain-containing protein [bacterium]